MMAQTAAVSTKNTPEFRPGDTVRVHLKVVEGESERIQVFEGTVIRRRGVGLSENFTVRKISFGVGVERIFPIFSPRIDKVELVRPGRVRRARLFYLRKLSGKAARLDQQEETPQAKTAAPAESLPAAVTDSKPTRKAEAASPAPITT